jgi:hypothetical protein
VDVRTHNLIQELDLFVSASRLDWLGRLYISTVSELLD